MPVNERPFKTTGYLGFCMVLNALFSFCALKGCGLMLCMSFYGAHSESGMTEVMSTCSFVG